MRPGYKQTDVGVIPEDWEVVALGEAFDTQLGKMLDAEKNRGEAKPYIGNRAVQWGVINTTDVQTMRMTQAEQERFRLKSGDLLVCEGGEIGRSAIWLDQLEECYFQKALHRLRPRGRIETMFATAILQSYAETAFFENYVTQTSIAHLPKEKLVQIPIPAPPLPEQRAIAGVLSDVDAALAGLGRLIAKKKDLKLAAMQQLLTGQTRLPGFTAPWEVKRLGEVAEIKTGPFGAQLHERDYVDSGTPIITVEHLGEFGITVDQFVPQVSDSDKIRLKAYQLCAGDIVFSRVGSIDRNALIQEAEVGWLFSGRLLRVRLRSKDSPAFMSYLFHATPFKRSVLEVAVGQTMASLNTKILAGISVNIPTSLEEQKAIAMVLSDIDRELLALGAQLKKTKLLKQAMMQELLTGRTRLPLPPEPEAPNARPL